MTATTNPKGSIMMIDRQTFIRYMTDTLTRTAADMTGANAVNAMMVAGIAIRCAYSLTGRVASEAIVYNAMYLAQRNGHTALPSNAAKLVNLAMAADEVLARIPR